MDHNELVCFTNPGEIRKNSGLFQPNTEFQKFERKNFHPDSIPHSDRIPDFSKKYGNKVVKYRKTDGSGWEKFRSFATLPRNRRSRCVYVLVVKGKGHQRLGVVIALLCRRMRPTTEHVRKNTTDTWRCADTRRAAATLEVGGRKAEAGEREERGKVTGNRDNENR